jgi:hypothetical protein
MCCGGRRGSIGRKADSLTAICELNVWKVWQLRRHKTLRASMAYYRDSFSSCGRIIASRFRCLQIWGRRTANLESL